MNRIDRLNALHILLQSRSLVKASELAKHFGITERTVYRDIRSLQEADVPIVGESGVGYSLDKSYRLPAIRFDTQEALSMLIAGKASQNLRDPNLQQDFDSALNKIRAVLPRDSQSVLEKMESSIQVVLPRRSGDDGLDRQTMETLHQAIAASKILEIHYLARSTQVEEMRLIEPLGLVYYTHNWHLIAWCQKRQDYRDFRVDRLTQIHVTSSYFQQGQRMSLQEYMERQKSQLEVVLMEIEVTSFVAKMTQEYRYSMGFVSEEEGSRPGWVKMSFWASSVEYFARWVISLVPEVQVLGPPELKSKLKTLAQQAHDTLLT